MTSKPEQVAFEAWWDAEQRKSFARAYGPAEPFRDGWNSGSKRSAQEAWMARAEHHETATPHFRFKVGDSVMALGGFSGRQVLEQIAAYRVTQAEGYPGEVILHDSKLEPYPKHQKTTCSGDVP